MKINPIILGSTGMVGEGVLHECLSHPGVEDILIINRRPCGIKHKKITEIVHQDFYDFSSIKDQLAGYNACYFCMGVSSLGLKEDEYKRITYDLTMYIANLLLELNPEITFCYVSGAGTDSSEKGRSMWARVKGKTENDLMNLPLKSSFMFRPGYIQPTAGLKNAYKIYKFIGPFYPIWNTFFPKYVCTLKQVGLAMINSVIKDSNVQILEVKDIRLLADKG